MRLATVETVKRLKGNVMIDFDTAARPFVSQTLSIVDYDEECVVTLNGAYANVHRWTGTEWEHEDLFGNGNIGDLFGDDNASSIDNVTVGQLSAWLHEAWDKRVRPFAVIYASAGCLPDSDDVPTFRSEQAAREYIEQEWEALADDDPAWNDDAGNPTDAYVQAIDAIQNMGAGSGADDPRPGSLYRWELIER